MGLRNRYNQLRLLFIVIYSFFAFHSCSAQNQKLGLSDIAKQSTVEKIIELVNQHYVFPDVAKKCGEHIQNKLEQGSFTKILNPNAFARQVTSELQHINHDKHMRVRVRLPEHVKQEQEDPEARRKRMEKRFRDSNYGFQKLEHFDENIGYLDLRGFVTENLGRETAIGAMKFLANSDAVIIDLRKNGGGDPKMVQLICSYFFDKKVHLNSLYWRRNDTTHEFWTLDDLEGKRMADVPLFILTSNRTFSGAEEFCYNMQTRNRATLIGKTTGGGANPGGTFTINEQFSIFIPTGRAINPVTGTNWEGVGVKPDIDVDARDALDKAIDEAQKAAEEYRIKRKLSNK